MIISQTLIAGNIRSKEQEAPKSKHNLTSSFGAGCSYVFPECLTFSFLPAVLAPLTALPSWLKALVPRIVLIVMLAEAISDLFLPAAPNMAIMVWVLITLFQIPSLLSQ